MAAEELCWLSPEEVGVLTGLKPNSYRAQCRALARIIPTEAGAATYLRYDESYDALAEQEERLARDAAQLEINDQQS